MKRHRPYPKKRSHWTWHLTALVASTRTVHHAWARRVCNLSTALPKIGKNPASMRETTQERISCNGLQIPNRLRYILDESQAAASSPECVCLPVPDIASPRQHHERREKASFKIALLAVMCIGSQITTKLIVRHKTKGMDSRQNIDFQPKCRFGKPAMGLNTMPNQHEEDRTQPCSTCQSNPCHSSPQSSQIGFAGKSLALHVCV